MELRQESVVSYGGLRMRAGKVVQNGVSEE